MARLTGSKLKARSQLNADIVPARACPPRAPAAVPQQQRLLPHRRHTLALTAGLIGAQLAPVDKAHAEASEGVKWAKQDYRRMLHAVLGSRNIKDDQAFYNEALGMQTLRYRSFPDGSANGFSGYLAEDVGFSLELVQKPFNPAVKPGPDIRHFRVVVPSLERALMLASERSAASIVEGVGPDTGEVYVTDPSGYLWEMEPQNGCCTEPFRGIELRVTNLERSLRYYVDLLGMSVVSFETVDGCKQVGVCWGNPDANVSFVLTQMPTNRAITLGENGYIQTAVSTLDVYRTAAEIRAGGGAITREPAPIPGIGTRVMKTADPDGWTIAFVDYTDFLGELCKAGKLSGPICDPPAPPSAV